MVRVRLEGEPAPVGDSGERLLQGLVHGKLARAVEAVGLSKQ